VQRQTASAESAIRCTSATRIPGISSCVLANTATIAIATSNCIGQIAELKREKSQAKERRFATAV
jgi:hypothetical protein